MGDNGKSEDLKGIKRAGVEWGVILGQIPVVSFCEYGNESFGSMK